MLPCPIFIYMPKTHTKHKNSSFMKGDLVEFVGIDSLQRGIGIVIEEVSHCYYNYNFEEVWDKVEAQLTHVNVYWQGTGTNEVLHKARVRRIAEVTKINLKKIKE